MTERCGIIHQWDDRLRPRDAVIRMRGVPAADHDHDGIRSHSADHSVAAGVLARWFLGRRRGRADGESVMYGGDGRPQCGQVGNRRDYVRNRTGMTASGDSSEVMERGVCGRVCLGGTHRIPWYVSTTRTVFGSAF